MNAVLQEQRNPLLEVLDQPRSTEDWVALLAQRPPFDPSERMLPPEVRLQQVLRLREFFVPRTDMLRVAERIDVMIRSGYTYRNPLTSDRAKLLESLYKDKSFNVLSQPRPVPPAGALLLTGASGVGKSTLAERVVATYPQAVEHPDTGLIQVTWLKADVPPDGSLKGFIFGFFDALHDALGEKVAPEVKSRKTVDELIPLMIHYAASYSLGLFIADELQHLTVKKKEGRELLLNAFENIRNKLGVPEMLIGTMKVRRLFQSDFRHARKSLEWGSFTWAPLRLGAEWDLLLKQLWRYQWTEEELPLTEELSKYMHDMTQGIVALVPLLFSLAQMKAIGERKKRITKEMLRSIVDKELGLLKPMLRALRSGDMNKIAAYEDIWPADMHELLSNGAAISTERVATKLAASEAPRTSAKDQAIMMLEYAGFDPDMAKSAVEAVATDKSLTARQLVRRALEYTTAAEREAEPPEGDVRYRRDDPEPNSDAVEPCDDFDLLDKSGKS